MKNKNLKRKIKNSALYPILYKVKNFDRLKKENYFDFIQSNIIGGHITVTINNIPGNYELDVRSDILRRILVTKEYEPEVVKVILKNIPSNSDAINIGANVGLFTNLLAMNLDLNNKVLAVEPTNNAHRFLKNNISNNNNEKKVITFKGIITDKNGSFSINTIAGKEEYSSIGNLTHDAILKSKFNTEEIEGITLDDLVKTNQIEPKLLVIDVEGSEYKVFKGGLETLKKYKPIIISELDDNLLKNQNTNSREVIELLESLNYKVTDIDGSRLSFPFEGNIIAE